MKLNIVTPLSRGQNLGLVYNSILWGKYQKTDVSVIWHVVIDKNCSRIDDNFMELLKSEPWVVIHDYKEEAPAGHGHRNRVLEYLIHQDRLDEWFYSLDDDNALHRDYLSIVPKYKDECEAIVVSQIWGDYRGQRRCTAAPKFCKLNHIDSAQFTFKVGLIGDMKFDQNRYDADGVFIEVLYKKHPNKFKFLDVDLSYYNKLR